MQKITTKQKLMLFLISLCYAPLIFADDKNWFPQLDNTVDITKGNSMSKIGLIIKTGGSMMLFITCIVMFVKFMGTVNHGIEVAKKNEGSLTDFTTFMLMGIIQLILCVGAGYLGYSIITNYKP